MGAGLSGRPYAPAVLWAILILVASAVPNVPAVGPLVTDKAAHFALFCVEGLLCFPALSGANRPVRRVLATFALILVFAALAESLQILVPGRFASLDDWLADALGAAVGLSLASIPLLRRKNTT